MPTLQSIGRQRGSWAPLLLITLFWLNGCQSLPTESEETVGSDTRWKITGQVGRVSLRSPGQSFWHRAIPGAKITLGSRVATFDGSRLELASAGDKVRTSGPSRFTLPNAERNGVRVRQEAGSLRYEVQSAPKQRFEVKTPHFSTVVKGTAFLVSVDRTGSEVLVDEGRVLILDPNGVALAELTAGQTGRMAAHPGATLEVSTPSHPSFETSTEPAAGFQQSLHGSATFPQTTNVTSTSLDAPAKEAGEPTVDSSLLDHIESVFSDMAASIRPSDAATTQGARLGSDRGGGAREEQERQSKGKGKGEGKGKGKGKGKGHGRGRGEGVGGRGASIIVDSEGHLIAWNAHP